MYAKDCAEITARIVVAAIQGEKYTPEEIASLYDTIHSQVVACYNSFNAAQDKKVGRVFGEYSVE